MKKTWIAMLVLASMLLVGCEEMAANPTTSASGVKKDSIVVKTGTDGLTTEQRNVKQRLIDDNQFGVIKHLYVISAYSGDVIIYSTVRGKVTSSGKRLSPKTVAAQENGMTNNWWDGMSVNINGYEHKTEEVLEDDGTYGNSVEYVYWWDSKSIYHQHYITGGQIFHVSSEPLSVGKVIINMDAGWTK